MNSLNYSLEELLDRLVAGTDHALLNDVLGALVLLLSQVARQQNADLLRSALRAIAESADDRQAKWVVTTVRNTLSPEQQAWFDTQCQAILSGGGDE